MLLAAGGFAGLVTPKIDLFVANSVAPSKLSVFADFTIATYTGYAGPIALTESAVYIPHGQGPSVDLSDAIFNGPTAGAGTDVIGAVVWNGVVLTPVVYAVILFDGPLGLQLATDRVSIDETLSIAPTVGFSVSN